MTAPLARQDAAITVRGLAKTYRPAAPLAQLLRGRLHGPPVPALEEVSFDVRAGEIVAVLGDNGAGKTTLLRCLAGLLSPSRGSAVVCGHDCARGGPALRRDAAYVTGDARSFAWRLSGRANLEFFAALHGYDRRSARARAAQVLALVGLEAAADRRFAEYSTGMRQRLALARGFLGAARVLLLDEPTAGLDPRAAREQRALVQALAGAGRAVLVSTHLAEEARALAARALVLRGGRVVHDGAVAAGLEAVLG